VARLILRAGLCCLLTLVSSDAVLAQTPATEQELLARVARQPSEIGSYLDLVRLYWDADRFDDAERVLAQARALVQARRPTAAPGAVKQWRITPAARTLSVSAVYPAEARSIVSGVVTVQVVLDRTGVVREAQVLKSVPMLDQAALEAVRQVRVTPTLVNGVPVETIVTVNVTFVLPPR
jgi:TonB family protein